MLLCTLSVQCTELAGYVYVYCALATEAAHACQCMFVSLACIHTVADAVTAISTALLLDITAKGYGTG
jgi:hypothetical protein